MTRCDKCGGDSFRFRSFGQLLLCEHCYDHAARHWPIGTKPGDKSKGRK